MKERVKSVKSSLNEKNKIMPSKYVVHCKKEPYDVLIDRSTEWGNPFTHISDRKTRAKYIVSSRDEAISEYQKWVLSQPELIEKIKKELKGKILGCHCKPKKCHGDILALIANQEKPNPLF